MGCRPNEWNRVGVSERCAPLWWGGHVCKGESAGRKSKEEVLKQAKTERCALDPNLLIPICCCSLQLSCRIAAYASTQFTAIVPERRGRTGTMCIAKEKNGRICAQAKWAEKNEL